MCVRVRLVYTTKSIDEISKCCACLAYQLWHRFCPHTVCALISDCAALWCSASHVASSIMLTRICRRLLNSQSASCSAQIAGNSGSEVGVRVGVKASPASASHDKWLPRQTDKWLPPMTPALGLGCIFSAHCGCHFRFSSSQVFSQLFCNAGCGLSAAKRSR